MASFLTLFHCVSYYDSSDLNAALSFLERLTLPDIWIDGAVDDERGGEGGFVEIETDVLCLVALQYSTFMDNHITSSHLRRGNLFF